MENNYRLVYVKWRDICATAGWEPADEVEPIEVLSVGWLFSFDGDTVKVGSTLGEDGEPYGITALPKGCVVEITDVCPESLAVRKVEPLKPSSRHDLGRTSPYPAALP